VAVMNAGRVEQVGLPEEIYRRPASLFVARFLGLQNLIPGEAHSEAGQAFIETALGRFPSPSPASGQVTVLLRPEAASLDGRGSVTIQGRVVERSFRGSTCRVVVEAGGARLAFEFISLLPIPAEGESIRLSFDPGTGIQVIPDGSN
jgi:ABC-type Fe3+/spermidine/putrescine transport system ATPase subunit